jgi:hypothetical protein
MVDKSIAYRLSLYVSLAVIAIFSAILIVFFLSNQKILRESTENNAIGLSARVSSLVNLRVISTQEIAYNVASQILYYSQNGDAEKLLSPVIKKYPFLNTIIVNIDTTLNLPYHYIFMQHNEGNYVFEQDNRPLYQSPDEKKVYESVLGRTTPGWTEPYFCQNKGNAVVHYYAPVPVDNENQMHAGFILCELSLSELSHAINQVKIGNRHLLSGCIHYTETDEAAEYCNFPVNVNTKNEVKQVANSLEYLKVWFEQYQIARETEEMNNHQHEPDLQQASEIQQSLIKTGSSRRFLTGSDIDLHALV